MNYLGLKNKVRNEAIEYQASFENSNYSWSEIIEKESYFRKQAKRYGLIKEFKENGII